MGDERTHPMKNTTPSESFAPPASAETATLPRYQIYRQTHTGTNTVSFKTDSAVDAVEAFLNQSPAFAGGEVRLWNHAEQRISASVTWSTEKTEFGFPVLNRTSVFSERLLGLIAQEMQVREEIREELQRGVNMSGTTAANTPRPPPTSTAFTVVGWPCSR
jgi:hypothetical protein